MILIKENFFLMHTISSNMEKRRKEIGLDAKD